MRDIEDYTKKYAERSFEKYQIKYRRKKVLEQIDRYRPSNILELGCGMEPLFLYLDNVRSTIVEPSEKFYLNAEKMAKGRGKNIRLINDYFDEDIGVGKDYDMIICSGLLHEVERPFEFLRSIRNICREDTVVHINVPNAYSVHRLLALEMGLLSDVHGFSERNITYQQNSVFDLTSLKAILTDAEMEIIEEGSYFVKFFSHEQMLRLIDKQIISEDILDGLYNLEKYMPGLGSEIFVDCKIKKDRQND